MAKRKKKAAKKKTGTRGGARPNSGPKPKMKNGRIISVWLGDEHLAKLDQVPDVPTRSEAIRVLIDAG
ncbi:hypothetical protein LCGC14_2802080 [marine sediment metagenome]|uniref:Uncharacterized protein n=1 Tax=marine sediment metagenome TaxID=412755 RepID=A0A0F8YME0_9ZZZZ